MPLEIQRRKNMADKAEQAKSAQPEAKPSAASADEAPSYDGMSVEELEKLASKRGVEVPADLRKANLITALRADDSGALPPRGFRNP